MTFQILEDAIELNRLAKPLVLRLEKHDRKLASQLRTALQSVAANVAEGVHRLSGRAESRWVSRRRSGS